MSARRARLVGAALTAIAMTLAVVGTSLAAGTAKNPSTLVLRQADFARGATYEADDYVDQHYGDALDAAGVDYEEANYIGLTYSEAKGSLRVSGWVIVTPSAAQARKAFAAAQKGQASWLRAIRSPKLAPLTLPSYGNQQAAGLDAIDPGTGIGYATVIVRKNSVVWFLHVGHERRPPRSQVELLADLRRFAAKQARRVGTGA